MTDPDTRVEMDPNFFWQLVKSPSDSRETYRSVVTDITNGHSSILKVVESLNDILTNQDLTIRRGGVEILTTILSELPENVLNAEEIKYFIDFYCCLLLDHHSFIPFILKGLLALVKMQQLPDHVVSKIFTAINLNFICQSQPQADRRLCYQLMNVMMDKKPAELQALGPDFVCGYLSIIDSERDPRNLMLLFERLPEFFKNFPLGHLAEDAFEAVSCYFPVDFRSNPKDPRGITRDDLSSALMPCLTANENFHSYVVDLVLEKFTSDLEIAKTDSLILMKQCFRDFPSDKIAESSLTIIPVLVDAMKPGNASIEIQQPCADVVAHILSYLYYHNESNIGEKVISLIYSNLEKFISDIELSFFLPTVRLLAKISASCSTTCQFLTSRMVPKLFSVYPQSTSQLSLVLECFSLLFTPCVSLKINCADILNSTWEQVTKLLENCCENAEKKILVAAFKVSTSIISLLDTKQKIIFYMQLINRIKSETDAEIWNTSADCLQLLAKTYPEEVKNLIDFELINYNPIDDKERDEFQKRLFQFFCVLAPVSGFPKYLDTAVRLHIGLQQSSIDFTDFIIDSIKKLLMKEKTNKFFLAILHDELKLTDYLLKWWEAGTDILPDSASIFDNEQTARNLTYSITIIIRSLDEKSQLNLAVDVFKIIDYSKRFMNSFYYLESQGDLSLPDLDHSLFAILNGIHPNVLTQVLREDLSHIVKYLTTMAVYCSRPFCCLVACRCLATIVNKFLEDSSGLQPQIEFIYVSVNSVFSKNKTSLTINAVNILFHLIKSLLYRNHADVNRCFDELLITLSQPEIHETIKEGFHELSVEDEYFLNAASHFRIESGFRERLFSCAVPKLLEFSKTDSKSVKHTCTISIVYLLANASPNIIQKFFKEIIPLLMSVLVDHESAEVVTLTLDKIKTMLVENTVAFEEYVETFLSRLTVLAREGKFMRIRIAALQCLLQFTKLNPSVILPFKSKISQELVPCLDDKKRLVRQEAVKTRSRWLVLGSM
ncbi:hypothetical protein V9T40_010944 [Parthenolecanium corni]|uniref:MMS19 nucleotide excision repair protein n=1 Tax=Parthenolecanium corni TaxID=536013 RepID=A0AAN9T8C3_9HEMI